MLQMLILKHWRQYLENGTVCHIVKCKALGYLCGYLQYICDV